MDDNRPTVTIIKAAEICGVSRRTIYNWLKKDSVQFKRTAGGSVRIYRDTLFRESNASDPVGPTNAESTL